MDAGDSQAVPPAKFTDGKEFERRVADFYRSLGCRVDTNIRLAGQEIDLLVIQYVEGMGPLSFMVECKDWARSIGNQDVQNFAATVSTLRASGKIHSGVLISRSGFTADAKGTAEAISYINLLTIDELEQNTLSASTGMRLLAQDYRDKAIFSEFVEVDGYKSNWDDRGGDKQLEIPVENVCTTIRDSVLGGRIANFFLLGDYGAGKTTLLRRLQYQLCEAMLNGRTRYLPVFVPLKNYYDIQDISILLRNSLRDDFHRELSAGLLSRCIRQGRFVFLLDGFDEMAERSGEDKRYDLFQRLLPVLASQCPIVLTSRPSLFVARGEMERLVSRWRTESVPLPSTANRPAKPSKNAVQRYDSMDKLKEILLAGLRSDGSGFGFSELPADDHLAVITLSPFDSEKIKKYITRRLDAYKVGDDSRPHNVDSILSFIKRVYDLSDLAKRPLLLRLIVDTVLRGGIDVTDRTLKLGPSDLYEVYTSLKLEEDWNKGAVRRQGLSREQRRHFAEIVAVAMYESGTLYVELSEILRILPLTAVTPGIEAAASSPLSADELATDFLTCSFLVIDDRQICRFVHKSFMEFFVARMIKSRLSPNNSLLQKPLPAEILYFLGGFAPTDRSTAEQLWVRFTQAQSEQVTFRRNLLAAYLFSSPSHGSRRVKDAELSDVSYETLVWSKLNMRRCVLFRVNIQRLDLRKPDWAEVMLKACSFRSWRITGGSLSCEADDSEFGSINVKGPARIAPIIRNTQINYMALERTNGIIELHDTSVDSFSAQLCNVTIRTRQSRVSTVDIRDSMIKFDRASVLRDSDLNAGVVRNSVMLINDGHGIPVSMRIDRCVIDMSQQERGSAQQALGAEILNISNDSCIYAYGIEILLKRGSRQNVAMEATCGVLGATYLGSTKDARDFCGWGVLIWEGEEAFRELPKKGYLPIREELMLCTREWFNQQAFLSDALGTIREIDKKDMQSWGDSEDQLQSVLTAVRAQVLKVAKGNS